MEMPDLSAANNQVVHRPAVVTVLAYWLLMSGTTTAIYLLLFGKLINVEIVAIVSNTPMPSWLQWKVIEWSVYANFLIGIGLLFGQRWARLAYVILGAVFTLLFFYMAKNTSGLLKMQLFFGLPLFCAFIYFLYRKDVTLYFISPPIKRPRSSLRRRCGAYLSVFAAVFVFWSLNAIAMGITEIYPRSINRDKLTFLALPIILLAEWIGKRPEVLSRISMFVTALALYIGQMFLYKYVVLNSAQFTPSFWQLRNWTVGLGCSVLLLLWLVRSHARRL